MLFLKPDYEADIYIHQLAIVYAMLNFDEVYMLGTF